jgi:hypothetical protein
MTMSVRSHFGLWDEGSHQWSILENSSLHRMKTIIVAARAELDGPGTHTLNAPEFTDDIALRIVKR